MRPVSDGHYRRCRILDQQRAALNHENVFKTVRRADSLVERMLARDWPVPHIRIRIGEAIRLTWDKPACTVALRPQSYELALADGSEDYFPESAIVDALLSLAEETV